MVIFLLLYDSVIDRDMYLGIVRGINDSYN